MHYLVFRYGFEDLVPMDQVESTLMGAILAVESLHGETETRLESSHFLDQDHRICVIDAGTRVGKDLNRLFVGFLRREVGEEAFRVERIVKTPTVTAT